MGDFLAGVGLCALGVFGILVWMREMNSPHFYRRSVETMSTVGSSAFARGLVGGNFLLSVGCTLGGLLLLADPWVNVYQRAWIGQTLLVGAVTSFVTGIAVTWLGRPKFLFPRHARKDIAPWREALDDRRTRRSKS